MFDTVSYLLGKASSGSGGVEYDRSKQNSTYAYYLKCRGGYVGGFEQQSYIAPVKADFSEALDVDWRKPFVFNVRFKTVQVDSNHRECLYGCTYPNDYFHVPLTLEYQNNTEWWGGFSLDGSSWGVTFTIPLSELPIVANQDYNVRTEYDGSEITVTITSGALTVTRTLPIESPLHYSSDRHIGLGNIANSTSLYARYTYFDLDNCYIDSEGVRVWGPSIIER